ncbi:PQQ-binding-like beta-propeller repeat protein [Rufibacter glacialis]|uniref:PQQ-binding-like beta-propeller repeat protein n=1 Tax=Rufibacter glacialis TaxID=1259555 RepID=A0A5M8QPJ4_9BACT|nr:PQQ-binding-like beta-propeller repeat protein [Rufibacter glacialis]KAA6437208.1 PQQ-binding-like beta-propeller repeat protein [Rufibacter glacialis]GGK61139.1 serine/threonine protein kinase [Rufibacter glacialis]
MDGYLKTMLLGLLLPLVCLGNPQAGPQRQDTLKFAVVTDTHIGKPGNSQGLAAIVQDINKNPDLDFVLHAGDVSDFGYDEQLAEAKALMEGLKKPYYIVPGNHDTGWSGSGGLAYDKQWQEQKFVADVKGVRLIGVSTGPYGRMANGYVPKDQMRWLDSLVAVTPPQQPVLFLAHYPLEEGLSNHQDVLAKLAKLNTLAIFCGHGHANKVLNFGGMTGIMSRTAQLREGTFAYNVVSLTEDSLFVRMVEVGRPGSSLWAALPLNKTKAKAIVPPPKSDSAPIAPEYKGVRAVWTRQDQGNLVSTPAVWKNSVLIGNLLGVFTSLDLRSGKEQWQFQAGQAIYSSPAVAGDRVVFASADSSIYCLNARNGKLLWKVKTGGPVVASPTIQGNRVYIGSSDLTFRALDLATGKSVWTYAGLAGFPPSQPTVAGGKVVFGTWGKTLYALNSADGTLAWEWKNQERSHYYSPAMAVPVVQNGKVYMVAPDEKLREFDLATGRQTFVTGASRVRESLGGSPQHDWLVAKTMQDTLVAWSTKGAVPEVVMRLAAGFGKDFSPSMPAFEGHHVYVGTSFGRVYAVDMDTRKTKWVYQLSQDMVNTVRPLPKGKVVVTSADGTISLLQPLD